MSNSYASLIDACLESIIHEKSLLYDSLVYSLSSSLLRIAAFISYACNSMIKIMIACHFRNYLCYRLPTRGRVGTKLGDADTSPTYP